MADEKTVVMSDSGPPQDRFVEVEVIGQVDRYQLLRHLGAGAFGAVYWAYDTVAQIQVAIKAMPREIGRAHV